MPVVPALVAVGGAIASKAIAGGGGDAPQAAPIVDPVTGAQHQQAWNNSQQGLNNQADFTNALQGQNGIANQSQVFDQLGNVVNGTGFNPAQAQLANATGANVANQSAMAAGQRNSGANAGLIARQAAMTGAGIQQQAAGQSAALQANQSLNALGQQGQIAGQQVGNLAQANQAYGQMAQQQLGTTLQAGSAANNAAVNQQNSINQINQQRNEANNKSNAALIGGIGQGVNLGYDAMKTQAVAPPPSGTGGGTSLGSTPAQFATGGSVGMVHTPMPNGPAHGFSQHLHRLAKGGNVGGKLKEGGGVPGQAKEAGNSYANDTVHAMLSPGEIVLPRSVTQGPNPAANAAAFVQAIMAKKGLPRK